MSKQEKIIFPFFQGIVFPVQELFKHFSVFLQLAGAVSLCYSVIILLMGQNYFCLSAERPEGLFCLTNAYVSVFSFLLWGFFLAYFINRWYLITKTDVSVKKALQTPCWVRDLKTFCFLCAYLGLWLLIGAVFYILKKRIATPDWVVELLYFTLGAVIIIVAVFLLLNSVLFVRYLQGKDWLVLKQTAFSIFDNIYKILAYFLFYLLLFVYLLQSVGLLFWKNTFLPLWLSGLLGSMANYMVVCALMVCFVSSLELQECQIFSKKEINQR